MRNNYDGEIGRGRRSGNDSSSSRESSPGRSAPKRPFSPAGSDAGETSMPVDPAPVTHSPPQERPLIRQAVAFASDKQPQNIVTYEATPPTVAVRFLPGQEVPTIMKKKAKRTKKGDMFSSQTSKFRIDTYDPTPSTQPPIAHGNGPYSSMYRGTPAPPKPPRKVSPATTASSSTYVRNSSTASSNPPSSYVPPYAMPPVVPQPPQAQPTNRLPAPPKKRAQPSSRFAEMDGPPPHQNHYHSNHSSAPGSNSSMYTPSPYYRHDYERGTWSHDRDSRSPRRKSRSRRSMDRSQDSDSSSRYQNRDSGRSNTQSSKSKYPLRMVTLLIQDVRSGTTDHQLAEVKVQLRPADESEGNAYWADAQDITKQLQRGPSRIDGPAKVYTTRGKYRHFILRVSKNNDDEFISANVAVPEEKTVDLVVEMLGPPGAPPAPPKIPSGLFDSPPHDDYEQELSSDQMDVGVKRPHQFQDARKRANSPSFDDYDGPESPPPHKISRHKYPVESARRQPQQRHPSPDSPMSSGPPPRGRRSTSRERRYYDLRPATPPIPLSPRPHEADFMRALKERVQESDGKGFADFFRSNAGNSVSDILSQYKFLTKIFEEFIGDKIAGFAHPIEEKHLAKLMKINDASFIDDCKETTRLMSMYGDPTFPRYDRRIAEVIEAKGQQSRETARKEFLDLLYRIDNIWNNRSPGGPRPPAKSSQTSSSDSSLSSRGDPAPSRATKAMFVD